MKEFSRRGPLSKIVFSGVRVKVARMNTVTTRSVLRELLPMFARFGLPDVLVTDNGPQFASAEFAVFVKQKGITHVTSSPHYAQSNGKSENAVKTLSKLLFAKAKQSGESEYMALLDWRNTPSEGMSTSPAQRLMGRRCKTLLPTAGTLLKPRYDTDVDTRALAGRKRRQSFYYIVQPTRTSAYADRRRCNRSYEASG